MLTRAQADLLEVAASAYLAVPPESRGEFIGELLDQYRAVTADGYPEVDDGETTRNSLDFGAAVLRQAESMELTGSSGMDVV